MDTSNTAAKPSERGTVVGRVAKLFRHPVKSMLGEPVEQADLETSGVRGDRHWALRELGDRGQILGGKQVPDLMMCRAWHQGDPDLTAESRSLRVQVAGSDRVYAPATERAELAAALERALGSKVELVDLRPATDVDHYRLGKRVSSTALRAKMGVEPGEPFPDLTSLPIGMLRTLSAFVTIPGTYFDAYPLHLLTTSSLRMLGDKLGGEAPDVRRFRPNILIETSDGEGLLLENDWCQGTLSFGDDGPQVSVQTRTVRCSMVMRRQPGFDAQPQVLRSITEHTGRHFGVYATVVHPGLLRVGDEVRFMPAELGRPRQAIERLGTLAKSSVFRVIASTLYRR